MNSTKYTELDLTTLKCTELKKLCKENRLKIKGRGRKFELIETLKSISQFSEEDDSDCTLEETVVHQGHAPASYTEDTERPVFGDISIITTNTPAISSVGNAKKRKIDGQTRYSTDVPLQNEQMSELVTDQDPLKTFSANVKEKEEDFENLIKRFEEPVKLIVNLLEKKKIELEKNRCTGENYLQERLEQKLSENEMYLRSKYEDEMKTLKTDKDLMEKILKEDFLKQLQQKEEVILVKENETKRMKTERETQLREREKLLLENQRLSNNMTVVDHERKKLKISVDELKKSIEAKENELRTQAEMMQAIESNVKLKVIETIEDEFTCIICQELFINAVTLPCAHSFCEMCLRTWFKTKKACPVCRRDVKLKALYSVVLDSVVECIIENMGAEEKRKRTNLLRERNEQKRRNDATEDPQGILKMIYSVNDSQVPGPANQPAAAVDNRRRSRSQSPARIVQNRQLANNNNNNRNNVNNNQANPMHINILNNNYQRNNYPYGNNNYQNRMYGGFRCFNCGGNHHIRDCPRQR